jgi:predicted nucleotidyltransferase
MKTIIGGKEVEIEWNQATARRLSFRASKHGINVSFADFTNPQKAHAAYVETMWLLLPPDEFSKHATPEDLSATIDHDTESESIVAAVLDCVLQMKPDAEKKSGSGSTPSPE